MAVVDLASLPNKTIGTLAGSDQILLNTGGAPADVTVDVLAEYVEGAMQPALDALGVAAAAGTTAAGVVAADMAALESDLGSAAAGKGDALVVTAAAPGGLWTTVRGFIAALLAPTGSSLVGYMPAGTIAATTVQGAINEIVSDLAAPTGASLVGYMPAGVGAQATTIELVLKAGFVSPLNWMTPAEQAAVILGGSVSSHTAAFQAAINSGKNLELFGLNYNVANLTQSTAGQAIVSSRGVAKLYKNANGPVLTSTGANLQMQNCDWRDDNDLYTGSGVVASGANPVFLNCGGYRIFGPALVATGNHVTIRGTCNIYHSRTSADYDIEVGVAGTATLYHDLTGVYTSQTTGGIRMTSTGTSGISGSQYGKLTCVAGGAPAGSGGPRIVNNRINGVVTTDQANGIFGINQFNGNVTLEAGALNTAIEESNVWAVGATLTNNSGGDVPARIFSSSKTSLNSLAASAQVTQFGGSTSLAFMSARPTGEFEFFGQVYANGYALPNNVSYMGRQTTGAGGALFNLARVDSSNNLQLGSNAGNYTQINGSSNGIYLNVANTSIAQWYASGLRPQADNTMNLGTAAQRWATVYAGTGTINTSDGRLKTQIESLSAAERRVAVTLRGLMRKFKFCDSVAIKGDKARVHFGVIAQDVKTAFEAEGLDAFGYALLCYDEWGAVAEIIDEDGNVIAQAIPAGNRYGVRYEELICFVLGAL